MKHGKGKYDCLKWISDDVAIGHVVSTKGMTRAEFLHLITKNNVSKNLIMKETFDNIVRPLRPLRPR